MGEKGKNEVIKLDHFFHEHPLILTERAGSGYDRCYGCRRFIFSGETIYRCGENYCSGLILHEECAEMPREITLSLHPQHTLIQKASVSYFRRSCAVCEERIYRIGYYCSSSNSCNFQIHVGCAQSMDVMGAAAAGERSCTQHPSHPQHELTLLWRPGRAASLRCDACGAIHRGNSYLCTVCQYCINESCAALPATLDHHLHDHPLSLAYRLPLEYIKFGFKCDMCFKDLLPKYWVYHCGFCRYVAHINCAITTSPVIMSNIDVDAVDGDVIAFPINDAVEELIGRFVRKLGVTVISHDNEIVKGQYILHNPDHQLRLISSSRHDQEEDNCDDDEDDDDDLNYGLKSTLVCEGCTAPILQKKQKSSSSSNKYISCGECKYSHHLPCFQLPTELPSHPLHQTPDHILTLQTRPKLDFVYCSICRFYTNGLFYECKMCDFKVDIKCISLPDTIKHAAHPHHHLKLLTKEITRERSFWQRACGACGYDTFADVCYRCDVCQVILHSACALLPAQVTNPRWDKHPLPLTFDASANHPSSFYCEVCEEEMNPKRLMYHCRACDVSIHPRCLPTASGEYRNIKFGQRYDVATLHHHPLAYQLLTKKLRCDVCGKRKDYGTRGFQCASHKCDFFICLFPCGRDHKDAMHAHSFRKSQM